MITCYLFADYLDDEQGLNICLNEQGVVTLPLAQRSIEEIKSIQTNARTVVVLSTIHSTLHQVELPWLSDKKARLAIPFAIEEQLVQNVNELHFAFDRQNYRHNHYLVVVIDKQWLEKTMKRLESLGIDFDVITLDWFALREQEICVTKDALLVYDELLKGALGIELCDIYLKNKQKQVQGFVFQDAPLPQDMDGFIKLDECTFTWIAKRLFLYSDAINLCQGVFQHKTRLDESQFWFKAIGILMGSWILIWLIANTYSLHSLNQQITGLDAQIAKIYHEFYPKDKRVISPEFRIRQLLKSDSLGQGGQFWPLLGKLAHSPLSTLTIEQMRFQNNILAITVTAKDFAALEQLQTQLQKNGVKVVQTQASSSKQKILATLELSL